MPLSISSLKTAEIIKDNSNVGNTIPSCVDNAAPRKSKKLSVYSAFTPTKNLDSIGTKIGKPAKA
ncbi:hypothetical protein [Streptococcus suis]|uniref:hypothetical protein n=1 Tax=Streptococcus suis TaxID=1307 RepID=UPI003708CE8B